MKINPHIQAQRNLRNIQQIGGHAGSVRKRDLEGDKKSDRVAQDQVSLSEQSKRGRKAGETTGIAGRKGAEETKKTGSRNTDKAEVKTEEKKETSQLGQEKTLKDYEKSLFAAGEKMSNEIKNLPPEKKEILAQIEEEVNQYAESTEQTIGQKVDRSALFAQRVMNDDRLKDQKSLKDSASNYLKVHGEYDKAFNQDLSNRIARAGGPVGMTPEMLSAMGGAPLPGGPGQAPPGEPGAPGQTPPGQQPGQPGAPVSETPMTDAANKAKMAQDDMQQARSIYMQMAADRQKWMMKMWEILQDLQTQIMEIMQGVAMRRAAKMDAIAAKWAAVLGGYDG